MTYLLAVMIGAAAGVCGALVYQSSKRIKAAAEAEREEREKERREQERLTREWEKLQRYDGRVTSDE